MSRLQKKCFLGAASMHVLLFVVLIVGPGFFSKDETMDESEVITVLPDIITENGPTSGGAPRSNPSPAPPTPTIQNPPTPPPPRVQEQSPQPNPPKVREPEQVEQPEKEKPTPPKNRESLDPKPDKPKKPHQVQVNRNVVKISTNQRTTMANSSSMDTAAQEKKERELLANAIGRTASRVKEGLSSTTTVSMPEGPGGGGVSYASYAQVVRAKYTEAWRIPDDVTDDEATIKVSVTIRRDGTVISSSIIKESGSRLVDRSIQNALDRVTNIGVPFPAGAKESQRTFTINFSLKAKKLLG